MGFQGYKLKRKLTASWSSPGNGEPSFPHVLNYEIYLFIRSSGRGFIRFGQIEEIINDTLDDYGSRPLQESPPFDKADPTLENVGVAFFHMIKKRLGQLGVELERLEISENRVKTYIASQSSEENKLIVDGKEVSIDKLLLADTVSQAVGDVVLSSFTREEAAGKEAAPTETKPFEADEVPINTDIATEPELPPARLPDTAIKVAEAGNRVSIGRILLCIGFLAICGTAISIYLYDTGAYPSGADIYGHLFKSDLLYSSIKNGDYYPLYTELWYNGVQPFRYWAPLPYYLLAALQFLVGGDVLISYLAFVTLSFIIGGAGWLLWGIQYKRLLFCTFLAVMWFVLPDNIRVFFVEGNLPRMVVAIFLPYLFFFIWRFVDLGKKGAILPVVIIMCMVTLCHVMIAAMIGITAFIFLSIYSISQRRASESLYIILAMLLSFFLCGLWLFPALQGGIISMDSSATAEVMRALSTPASVSLNPVLRNRGLYEFFYFGISMLAISVAGLLWSDKKSRGGFLTVLIVFLGTLPVVVPFLEKLPFNQLLWMTRFTPVVCAVFFLSLLEWKSCRRFILLIVGLALVLDSIPSLDLQRYHSQTPAIMAYALKDIKAMTDQRISLLDQSAFGSYPSFGIATEEPRARYTFGWAWQGAATSYNIMMLNTALERGYFRYLFDRSLELGDDVVLVHKEQLDLSKRKLSQLVEDAAISGYDLTEETNYFYIFKKRVPNCFGVATEYEGLAIGSAANLIALEYPVFEEGSSGELTDYTLEDLKKYKTIYLSAFTYKDKKAAEELLIKAAESGVRIILDMNRIPVDQITNRMSFLGVTAQPVSFSHRFPELIFDGRIYETEPFKDIYAKWNTVYLDNLDEIHGYSWFQNKELPFIGTVKNRNLILLGYNFLFHAMEANDKAAMSILSRLTGLDADKLPERRIVPLKITYSRDRIKIDSAGDKVNTTIGFQDIFQSNQAIENQNNLLVVKEKHTEIELVYSNLKEGILITIAGLLGTSLLIWSVFKRKEEGIEKRNN